MRSENILFFPTCDDARLISDPSPFEDLLFNPILMDFSFLREVSPSAISKQPSKEVGHDIYRHPEVLGQPSKRFDEDKDDYALGMVLSAIAEWRPLRSILKACKVIDFEQEMPLDRPSKIQSFMLQVGKNSITQSVAFRLGRSYHDMMLLCLNVPLEPIRDNSEGQDVPTRQERFEVTVREPEKCKL